MLAVSRGLEELSHTVKAMAKSQAEMQLALTARMGEAHSDGTTAQRSTRKG